MSGIPKILVLGASGMLGSALYRYLVACGNIYVIGTERGSVATARMPQGETCRLITGIDVEEEQVLESIVESYQPTLVVNCIAAGTKAEEREMMALNALLPHRIARLAARVGARFLHIGTDGVFSGLAGGRTEQDVPDPVDLYGRTKLLGEVKAENSLTLRTSIIGPELSAGSGLLSWFWAQRGTVKGFRRMIFSGFTTIELSRIIVEYILPRPHLAGLLHVASQPISKFDLLSLVAEMYQMEVRVVPDDRVTSDRSLDSTKFRGLTGYHPPDWKDMIAQMRDFG